MTFIKVSRLFVQENIKLLSQPQIEARLFNMMCNSGTPATRPKIKAEKTLLWASSVARFYIVVGIVNMGSTPSLHAFQIRLNSSLKCILSWQLVDMPT